MSVEIESCDVIKLMIQFCRENGLTNSLLALQRETGVTLNSVDSVEGLLQDVREGRWDVVLAAVGPMQLPLEISISIHEQVLFELLESGAKELAIEVLAAQPLASLRTSQLSRWHKLDQLCKKGNSHAFQPSSAYEMGSNKQKRRAEIALSLSGHVSTAPPSRLLALLGQALQLQHQQGTLTKAGTSMDLFHGGRRAAAQDAEELYVSSLYAQIKVGAEAHPEAAVFAPDGQSLVLGSVDGIVEVWEPDSCKVRLDLDYQARDELMMHQQPVLCATFSREGEHLATGCQGGQIKVWKLSSGTLLRKFTQAHSQGVTCIAFSRDGSQLLSGSFDASVRLHGIRSGKLLREYRGHTSYVNCVCYAADGVNFFSASSDGTVRCWDGKSGECLHAFRPGAAPGLALSAVLQEKAVHTLQLLAGNAEGLLFVAARSGQAFVVRPTGEVVRALSVAASVAQDEALPESRSSGDISIVCAAASPRGRWAYCVTEDGALHAFDIATGLLEHSMTVATKGAAPIGLAHHPHRNLLLTFSDDGLVKMWKAE